MDAARPAWLHGRVRLGARVAKQIEDAGRRLWWCQRQARRRRDAQRHACHPGVRGCGARRAG